MNALKRFFSGRDRRSRRSDRRGENRRRATMFVESLEGRQLLSTFSVTNTSDSGSGSLRAAITACNTAGGTNAIAFSIPASEGTSLGNDSGDDYYEIDLKSALPQITDSVTILGFSQTGSEGYTPIELNGAKAGSSTVGLTIAGNGAIVSGLSIVGFQGGGVEISGSQDELTQDWVGLMPTRAALGNAEFGVELTGGSNDTVVASTISANKGDGVMVTNFATADWITENMIGVPPDGSVSTVGNLADGVYICDGAHGNTIGGLGDPKIGEGNVISDNLGNGVHISAFDPYAGKTSPANNNLVQGNYVGLDLSGSFANGVNVKPCPERTIIVAASGRRWEVEGWSSRSAERDGVPEPGRLMRARG